MNKLTRFIVIDDDLINNMLCRHIITKVFHDVDIETFNNPEKGLEYISRKYADSQIEILTVLFLDINMPVWSGWDFLDHFEKLEEKIKKQIRIFMLSSSIDATDSDRARRNKNVVDYFEKPLDKITLQKVFP